MTDLSIISAYYRNPMMLAHQYATWAAYPDDLKARIEIIIVDDGSPEPATEVERPEGLPALRIYRHIEDRMWWQHAARNRGAHHAAGDWLLLTDIDHVLPEASLGRLLKRMAEQKGPPAYYTFHRLDAPDLRPKLKNGREHPHPNTFCMPASLYEQIGGYDERFCGIYGTDAMFRRSAQASAREIHLRDVPVVRYDREVIEDASTRVERDDWRDHARRKAIQREVEKHQLRPLTLTLDAERVL